MCMYVNKCIRFHAFSLLSLSPSSSVPVSLPFLVLYPKEKDWPVMSLPYSGFENIKTFCLKSLKILVETLLFSTHSNLLWEPDKAFTVHMWRSVSYKSGPWIWRYCQEMRWKWNQFGKVSATNVGNWKGLVDKRGVGKVTRAVRGEHVLLSDDVTQFDDLLSRTSLTRGF